MGNSVALYNPPTRVAEEMAMLDVLSGGRLVAGFPVGTPMDTTYCYGAIAGDAAREVSRGRRADPARLERARRRSRSTASTPSCATSTSGRGRCRSRSRRSGCRAAAASRPGTGASSNDFLYAYLSYFGYQDGQKIMDGFWEAVDRHKLPRNPYRAGFLQFIAVADSDAEAERLYAEPALYFYRRCLHVYAGFVNPPGYMSMATLKAGIEGQVSRITNRAGARAEMATLSWKDLIDRGYLVAGSPATVADRINDMADKLNVGHLMTLLHFGNMSKEITMYNTRMFAEKVIPRLRPRFSEWDDSWFPRDVPLRRLQPAVCRRRSREQRNVSLPNGRRWQVYSGGEGPRTVWLHGLRGVDPADPLLAALQTRYRVTAPVAPGFNDLDELARIDNIHELALDYDDLIDAWACTASA